MGTRAKKRLLYGGSATGALALAGIYLFAGAARAGADFDPSSVATVERGTMTKSGGKIGSYGVNEAPGS